LPSGEVPGVDNGNGAEDNFNAVVQDNRLTLFD
jgi:hypothetical protein